MKDAMSINLYSQTKALKSGVSKKDAKPANREDSFEEMIKKSSELNKPKETQPEQKTDEVNKKDPKVPAEEPKETTKGEAVVALPVILYDELQVASQIVNLMDNKNAMPQEPVVSSETVNTINVDQAIPKVAAEPVKEEAAVGDGEKVTLKELPKSDGTEKQQTDKVPSNKNLESNQKNNNSMNSEGQTKSKEPIKETVPVKVNEAGEGLHKSEEKPNTKVEENIPVVHEAPKQAAKEVVQIKVGENFDAGPKELVEKLAKEVVVRTSNNKEFEVQLMPEELGKISVKILFENGKATVSFVCSNAKTYEMLSENAKALGSIVESNTGYTSSVQVKNEDSRYLHENYDGRGQERQQEEEQQRKNKEKEADTMSFIEKMRLGLIDIGTYAAV